MAGYGPGTPQYDNIQPTLRSIVDKVIAESGGRVWIVSGWRSNAQQASLYDAWINGDYDVPAVAKPGTSHHETGSAVDFGGDLRLAQEIGRRYGLVFPVRGEAWHAELGEGVDQGGYASPYGIQYNLNYTGGPPAKPEDILANRMASVMSMIGGDQFSSGAQALVKPVTEQAEAASIINPTQAAGALVDPLAKSMVIPEAGEHTTEPMGQSQQYVVPKISGTGPENIEVSFEPGGDTSQLGAYAQSLFPQFGFTAEDYPALVWLWNKESGDPRAGPNQVTWNPTAQNPTSTAFGIAQFLNGTWAGTGIAKTSDPLRQIQAGLTYIKARYGNPRNALAFHNRNNWY